MKTWQNNSKLYRNVDPITISLIGCGGTGNQMLTQLAKIHSSLVGLERPGLSVVAYDDDVVNVPNIGRQMFSPSDIGKHKSTVLIERINRFFGTQWLSIPQKYNAANAIYCNIIIGCVDNLKARKFIYRNRKRKDLFSDANMNMLHYYLDTGNGKDYGQAMFWAKKGMGMKTVFDVFGHDVKEEKDTPSCSMQEALNKQHLFINTIIATYAGALLWQLFTQRELSIQGTVVNLKTMKTNPILF